MKELNREELKFVVKSGKKVFRSILILVVVIVVVVILMIKLKINI
jgi:hypothetical protein